MVLDFIFTMLLRWKIGYGILMIGVAGATKQVYTALAITALPASRRDRYILLLQGAEPITIAYGIALIMEQFADMCFYLELHRQ